MTTGSSQGEPPAPQANFVSTRPSTKQQASVSQPQPGGSAVQMPPPSRPPSKMNHEPPLGSQSQHRPLRPQSHQTSTITSDPDPESLFMPLDEDRVWDPTDYEHEEEPEMLGYDASYDMQKSDPHPTFRDSGTVARPSRQQVLAPAAGESQEGLEPTQRLSQVSSSTQARVTRLTISSTAAARDVRLKPSRQSDSSRPFNGFRSTTRDHDEARSTSGKNPLCLVGCGDLIPTISDTSMLVQRASAVPVLSPSPCQHRA